MIKTTHLLLACLLLSWCTEWTLGQDYEEEQRPLPVRPRPPRGPIVPSRANKQAVAKTSTTEAPPAEEEIEYEDELVDEEQQQPATTTTTTEAPRKGIRGGVVRPFRSNTDLIEALKRRRAQAQASGTVAPPSTTSTQPPNQYDSASKSSSRKSKSNKFSRGGGSNLPSSTSEQPFEEPSSTPRSRAAFTRGRRF